MSINDLDQAADEMEHAITHGTRAEVGVALKELKECIQSALNEFNDCATEDEENRERAENLEGENETLKAENEMLRAALEKFASPRATEAALEGVDIDLATRCFPFS